MKTQIKIWSAVGNTPVTKRGSSFCDELVSETTDCTSPEDARQYILGLMKRTPHADNANFYMPEWPNQNVRSQWLLISDTFAPRSGQGKEVAK